MREERLLKQLLKALYEAKKQAQKPARDPWKEAAMAPIKPRYNPVVIGDGTAISSVEELKQVFDLEDFPEIFTAEAYEAGTSGPFRSVEFCWVGLGKFFNAIDRGTELEATEDFIKVENKLSSEPARERWLERIESYPSEPTLEISLL